MSQTQYVCEGCDYITSKRFNYNRHVLNDKHKNRVNEIKVKELSERYHCQCGKHYKHKQNLYGHKKLCKLFSSENDKNILNNNINISYENKNIIIEENQDFKHNGNIKLNVDNNENINTNEDISNITAFDINNENYKDIIEYLINQNNDLKVMLFEQQKQITELIPKVGNTTLTTNTNNFNINIFLNEKCKNAVSITDFIKNIDVTIKDIMVTKEKGFADGLSNIFIENMNKLSIYQRPIHCTDIKRETLYIKNDIWEKDENKEKIKNALQIISHKQVRTVNKLNKDDSYLLTDKDKEDYFTIIKTVTIPLVDNENKIIKKLCQNSYINSFDKLNN
jgi:hypothetical protein